MENKWGEVVQYIKGGYNKDMIISTGGKAMERNPLPIGIDNFEMLITRG